jgi:membrane protein implicated in regulation of membrane protease activity
MSGYPKGRDSSKKWQIARWWSLAGLVFIAGLSLIGLVIAWSGNPGSTTLRFEFAKTCMQVLAVAFFGALAAIATFSFQRSRTQEDDEDRRKEERKERTQEQKQRQNEQLRSIMEETLAAYNQVKRIRRLLKAKTKDGSNRLLTVTLYDEHMADLIDQQLVFERLKKLPPFIGDERISAPPKSDAAVSGTSREGITLAKAYEDIENYLNSVIGEYEKKRYTVLHNTSVSLAGFDHLCGFIGGKFVAQVSNQMEQVIDILQGAIWQDLGQDLMRNKPVPNNETQLARASDE